MQSLLDYVVGQYEQSVDNLESMVIIFDEKGGDIRVVIGFLVMELEGLLKINKEHRERLWRVVNEGRWPDDRCRIAIFTPTESFDHEAFAAWLNGSVK